MLIKKSSVHWLNDHLILSIITRFCIFSNFYILINIDILLLFSSILFFSESKFDSIFNYLKQPNKAGEQL
jgi:hypothetical protein